VERAQEGLVPLLRDQTEHVLKDCGVGSETTTETELGLGGRRSVVAVKENKQKTRRRGPP